MASQIEPKASPPVFCLLWVKAMSRIFLSEFEKQPSETFLKENNTLMFIQAKLQFHVVQVNSEHSLLRKSTGSVVKGAFLKDELFSLSTAKKKKK